MSPMYIWAPTEGFVGPLVALRTLGLARPSPLPPAPGGTCWHRIVDTNLPAPKDFTAEGRVLNERKYNIAPFSALLLQAQ